MQNTAVTYVPPLAVTHGKHAMAFEHSSTSMGISWLYMSTTGCLVCLQLAVHKPALIIAVAHVMQSGSTRPERIPATLAGLQELHRKTLQELQQQLQAHLTAAHQELQAQVMLSLAGFVGWGFRQGRWGCVVQLSLQIRIEGLVEVNNQSLKTLHDKMQHTLT